MPFEIRLGFSVQTFGKSGFVTTKLKRSQGKEHFKI